jgi:Type ISP C-terminal specificity domain
MVPRALEQFRVRYCDRSITKWGIFHYIYAVLHHSEYRQRYAANSLAFHLLLLPTQLCHPELRSRGTPCPPGISKSAKRNSLHNSPPCKSLVKTPRQVHRERTQTRDPSTPLRMTATYFGPSYAPASASLEIHVHYEQQPEYPLTKTEKAGEKLDYHVEKMKLTKDKSSLICNHFSNSLRHSTRNLRVSPGQPLGSRMGHRSISGLDRQAQRHHQ